MELIGLVILIFFVLAFFYALVVKLICHAFFDVKVSWGHSLIYAIVINLLVLPVQDFTHSQHSVFASVIGFFSLFCACLAFGSFYLKKYATNSAGQPLGLISGFSIVVRVQLFIAVVWLALYSW